MLTSKIENVILEFLKEAGDLAKINQLNLDSSKFYNKNRSAVSIVTETDIAISDLFKKTLEENFSGLNYISVDEEKLVDLGDDKWKTIDNSEYQFILDPIDGTLTYSSGLPTYGISVGILKDCKPYMGFVYIPATNELLYNNSKENILIKHPFSEQATTKIITKSDTNSKIIFDNSWFVDIDRSKLDGNITQDYYSAVLQLMYTALGRAKGYYFGVFAWDIAGCWASLNSLGYEIFNARTKETLTELNAKYFRDDFKVKGTYIVCKDADFKFLQEIATLKEDAAFK